MDTGWIWIEALATAVAVALHAWIIRYVWRDSARRLEHPVAWRIVALAFGGIGFLLYLVLRPKGPLRRCGSCFREMLATLVRCPHCWKAPDEAPAPKAKELATFLVAEEPLGEGAVLGPYRILGLVGRGGMGIVYRAEHMELQRVVALKVLRPDLESEFRDRFRREAQALARLRHPNIVTVFDVGEENGQSFLVMEYVEGATLRSVLRSGGLTPRQALHLVPKLCDALEYAHTQGVIHRDIKPENILIGKDAEPRIADFGLARIEGESLTRTALVMGTPDYMAPEQRQGLKDVDHRADIFSLGVVLYEMLTGQLPVGNFERPAQKLRIDVRIDSVVLRAMEHDRERRYARAGEMGTEVRSIPT